MDLVRFGIVIRALRRRKGWRQADLAAVASVSHDTVSVVERGHGDRLAYATLLRIAGAVEARLGLDLRWRGGELERLLDQDHAAIVALVTEVLRAAGWTVMVEVTYAVYGQNGSVDVLAWHGSTRTLLVVEVKTEVVSGESTLRKLDEKVRLGAGLARERFGWHATHVSRLLVIEDTTTARRRVTAAQLFDVALPLRGVAVRRWLRSPEGSMAGVLFLPNSNRQRAMSRRGGRHRVRPATSGRAGAASNTTVPPDDSEPPRPAVGTLTNRT